MKNFEAGAVIVPAQDGILSSLGYDVSALNLDALGVILERGSKRALVNFPALKKTLWMDFNEMADLEDHAARGDKDYQNLLPANPNSLESENLIWILSWLLKKLPLVQTLELEISTLDEVWDPIQTETIEKYYTGEMNLPACRLSLGLSSFNPEEQKRVRTVLGSRLLFFQLKPAGMHKFEVAFYLTFKAPEIFNEF